MEIHLNITFPKIPCELLTLDVMDVSGEQQVGVMHGVSKVRLAPQEEGGGVIDIKALELYVLHCLVPELRLTDLQTPPR
jgi:hypothetical protein